MKKYSIPIIWQSIKRFEVEAENLTEAIIKARETFFSIPDDAYIEDSYDIDNIISDEYPDEEIDYGQI